jgi:DNA-binding GntR family transcriptional regulator
MNLDRAFHRAIARAARNVVLADLLSTLHDRSLRFWFISLSDTEHMRQVQEEHLRILDAMERRDGPAAKAEMQGHIKSFRSTISERVRQAAGQ